MRLNQLIAFTFPVIFLLSQPAYTIPSDSAAVRPDTVQPRIECTRFTINGITSNNTPAYSSGTFDPSTCVDGTGGVLAIAGGVGGGSLGLSCPNDHPFMTSTYEEWGISPVTTGATKRVRCCQAPKNQAFATSNWENSVGVGCT